MITRWLQAGNLKYAFSFFLAAVLKHNYLIEAWLKFGEPLFCIELLQKPNVHFSIVALCCYVHHIDHDNW